MVHYHLTDKTLTWAQVIYVEIKVELKISFPLLNAMQRNESVLLCCVIAPSRGQTVALLRVTGNWPWSDSILMSQMM